jgi:hypothetical protein
VGQRDAAGDDRSGGAGAQRGSRHRSHAGAGSPQH